jgi:hypothetical protein
MGLDLGVSPGAVRAEMLFDDGGVRGQLPAAGHLAVEHAQRVAGRPALAVVAQFVEPGQGGEEGVQRRAVPGAAGAAAQGVDLEGELAHAQGAQVGREHEHQFGVGLGLGGPDHLHVELWNWRMRPFWGRS